MSSASADVALDARADEPAEALCEGGSCHGNHGFTLGAPFDGIERVCYLLSFSSETASSSGFIGETLPYQKVSTFLGDEMP
ncbi:MAG: hypothetical protein JW896_03395 [Deltaproteobacteria bacterium]|nr:hypothetical protein [Deltaproteobacteria bacterium]